MESSSRIEPCLLSAVPQSLNDTIADLAAEAGHLGLRLSPATARSLADLVRVMNCYYSNLIEGHNTRPREIEEALAGTLASSDERRDLQREALAHIRVQRWLDEDGSVDREPASVRFIEELHARFYEGATPRMLDVPLPDGTRSTLEPGQYRKHEVVVGRHQPPSPAALPGFMQHFEQRFTMTKARAGTRIVIMASAHHRLNYIHPFADGNGRVSRLMSHAMACRAGVGAHGLWSISRGLARGLSDRGEYKAMMDQADSPRRGDRDGRGNLSEEALIEFCQWFCDVALDQVRFMTSLFELSSLRERLSRYALDEHKLPGSTKPLLDALVQRGEVKRGDVPGIVGLSERGARDVVQRLSTLSLLTSESARGPLHLYFPVQAAEVLFPRLFGPEG